MTAPYLPGEDALILQFSEHLPPPRQTRLSIGDDAAAIAQPDGSLLLITTDVLMEDVHFRLRWDDLPALGWKALAQNLSDIAAMGGTPTHAVIAITIPPQWAPEQALELYSGIADLAAQSGIDIIGGDTARSTGPLTIAITVLGKVAENEILTRGGSHPGESIFVTGALGRAAAGLKALDSGYLIPAGLDSAVRAQMKPEARLTAARELAKSGLVTAMMDLSDGVATDLHRLCRASGIGAVIERELLPIDPVVFETCKWLATLGEDVDPVNLALTGGEDFELLLTADSEAEKEIQRRISPLPLTRIGLSTTGQDVLLKAGGKTSPLPWGFTHF